MDIAGQLCYNEQNYDRPRRERNVAAMKGTLIVIEGTDGSGKSTQFQQLRQRLEKQVLVTKTPRGSHIALREL